MEFLDETGDHTVTHVCTALLPASSPLLGYKYEALCHYVVSCHFNAAFPTHQNDTELGLWGQTVLMVISPTAVIKSLLFSGWGWGIRLWLLWEVLYTCGYATKVSINKINTKTGSPVGVFGHTILWNLLKKESLQCGAESTKVIFYFYTIHFWLLHLSALVLLLYRVQVLNFNRVTTSIRAELQVCCNASDSWR